MLVAFRTKKIESSFIDKSKKNLYLRLDKQVARNLQLVAKDVKKLKENDARRDRRNDG